MSKSHVDHRIVTRDCHGKIVTDVTFDSFATAEPAYQLAISGIHEGHEVSLQNGAPVIKSKSAQTINEALPGSLNQPKQEQNP